MSRDREEMSEEEYEIIDLEAELHGINEGFRIASEKLEAINNHANSFQYAWLTTDEICDWYNKLQEIIRGSKVNPEQ